MNINNFPSYLKTKDLWINAFPNIEKMMMVRGYRLKEQMNNCFFHFVNSLNKNVFLFCCCIEKMGVEAFREIIQFAELYGIKHLIIIFQNTWSPNCKKIIDNLLQYQIEMFELKEFQYCLTDLYYYVPHEKLLDKKLIQNIKSLYGNSLPILLRTDKVVKYFGFEKGDIIKIHRNYTDDNNICYRIVR